MHREGLPVPEAGFPPTPARKMNPPAALLFDDTHWPLLLVQCVGKPTLAQYEEFFAQRTRYLEREEQHVGITDATRLKLPPPEYRQLQSDWLKHNTPLLNRTLLGVATVVQTPDIVLYKSTSNFRSAVPYPTINVPSVHAGVVWAIGRFEDAGLGDTAAHLRACFGLEGSEPER